MSWRCTIIQQINVILVLSRLFSNVQLRLWCITSYIKKRELRRFIRKGFKQTFPQNVHSGGHLAFYVVLPLTSQGDAGGGGSDPGNTYVENLTSIAVPTLGSLTKNLGPRVRTFAIFARRNGTKSQLPMCSSVRLPSWKLSTVDSNRCKHLFLHFDAQKH